MAERDGPIAEKLKRAGALFVGKTNMSLQIKMVLVLIAGVNLLLFYFTGLHKSLDAVPADGDAAGGAKAVAAVSLFAWIMVIVMGRFIMYNDTLLYALGL